MAKIGLALQLYSVRDDCAKDFEGTLKAVAEMGYEGVEFAGYYGKTAIELRQMLDRFGLKVAGTHIGLETLLGDELKKTVEYNRVIGNKFLIVPGLAEERRNSADAWAATAGVFNEVAKNLKPEGMQTGYHNHNIEFQPVSGKMPWDIFFGLTAKEVIMQIDTGNAMHGGVKADAVVGLMEKYPGRSCTVHLKEFSSTNDKAILGEGEVKWKEFLSLCVAKGNTEWYIVEQESYAYAPLECASRCLVNLKKII